MKKILCWTKKIFLPDYVYEFELMIVDLCYFSKIVEKIDSLGGIIVYRDEKQLVFYTNSIRSKWGKWFVTINKVDTTKYKFHIQFVFLKKIVFLFLLLSFIFIFDSVISTGNIKELIYIPLAFIFVNVCVNVQLVLMSFYVKRFFDA